MCVCLVYVCVFAWCKCTCVYVFVCVFVCGGGVSLCTQEQKYNIMLLAELEFVHMFVGVKLVGIQFDKEIDELVLGNNLFPASAL